LYISTLKLQQISLITKSIGAYNSSNSRYLLLIALHKVPRQDIRIVLQRYRYGLCDSITIHVDAPKVDLGKIDIAGRKVGERWTIQTLTSSGNYSVGLVYGSITVEYKGNNSFHILPDTYDFDIHTDIF